jgi:hypothetical protein
MRRRPYPSLSPGPPRNIGEEHETLEGLVGRHLRHLAARAVQRRILFVGSVIVLVAIAALAGALIHHVPSPVAPY